MFYHIILFISFPPVVRHFFVREEAEQNGVVAARIHLKMMRKKKFLLQICLDHALLGFLTSVSPLSYPRYWFDRKKLIDHHFRRQTTLFEFST